MSIRELYLNEDDKSGWRETSEVQPWKEYDHVELWTVEPDEIRYWYELKQCLNYLLMTDNIGGPDPERNVDIYFKVHIGLTPTSNRQGLARYTFEEIANQYGIDESRVRQIERQVRRKLLKCKDVLIKQLKLI